MLDNNALNAISTIATPETFKGLVSLEIIFDEIGYTDHEHVVMGILSMDNPDQTTMISDIETCYREMVSSLYAKYGITVNKDIVVPLTKHATVLAGLFSLTNKENEDVFTLVRETESYEEALIILISEVTPLNKGFLMEFILECENDFINSKIDEAELADIPETENVDVSAAKKYLNDNKDIVPALELLMRDVGFIENPGYKFDAVLSYFLTERDFFSTFNETNVKVMLLLSLLSNDTVSKCKEMLIESLDDRISPSTYMNTVKRINTIFGQHL